MLKALLTLISISAVLFVGTACTQAPEVPRLPGGKPDKKETNLIRDRLDAQGLSAILKRLNQTGELNNLVPFFSDLTGYQQEALAGVLDRQIYQNSGNQSGLYSLLGQATEKRSFSEFRQTVDTLNSKPGFQSVKSLGLSLLGQQTTIPLINRLSFLLQDPYFSFLNEFLEIPIPGIWGKSKSDLTAKDLLQDLKSFYKESNTEKETSRLLSQMSENRILRGLLETLNQDPKQQTRILSGLEASLSYLLEENTDTNSLETENRLTAFLNFVDSTNRSSENLFSALGAQLENPGQNALLEQNLLQFLTRALSGYALETLKSPEWSPFPWQQLRKTEPEEDLSPTFVSIYKALQKSLLSIAQNTKEKNSALVAFVMTVWLENVATKFSPQQLNWEKEITIPDSRVKLVTLSDGGKVVFPHKATMEKLGIFHFLENETAAIEIEFPSQKDTLAKLFRKQLQWTEGSLPLSSGGSAFQSLLYFITRKDEPFLFHLSDLDSKDPMFNRIQRLMIGQDYEFIRKLKKILLEDLKIGTLPIETGEHDKQIDDFLVLFHNYENLQSLLPPILNSIRSIDYIDFTPIKGLMTPLEFYSRALEHWTPSSLGTVTELLQFLKTEKFIEACIGPKFETELLYPSVCKILGDLGLARKLYRFTALSKSQIGILESILAKLLVQSTDHPSIFSEVSGLIHWSLENKPSELEETLTFSTQSTEAILTPYFLSLSKNTRNWARTFIDSGEFLILWQNLQGHLNVEKSRALIRELLTLQQNHRLDPVFETLGYIDNDRLQSLSQLFLKLSHSGELLALLSAIDQILSH